MSKVLFHLYGVPFTSYKSAMLCVLRLSRGYLLALLYLMLSFWKRLGWSIKNLMKGDRLIITRWGLNRLRNRIRYTIVLFSRIFWHICLNKSFILNRCIFVNCETYPFGTFLDMVVGIAWLGEKMKVNVEIEDATCTTWQHFENNIIVNITDQSLGQRFETDKKNCQL